MTKVIECVPNFSEGQSKEIIDAISAAIDSISGVSLLDVDPGSSTNRTVYTFVGSNESVVEGALAASRVASQLIDMRKHSGEHPRLGALDVCPFIPVRNATMEDCVDCARDFGRRLAESLNVPVYLYGEASDRKYRKTVPQIRAGQYEGLAEKLSEPDWKPDYGPSKFVAEWGATMSGARNFLIAYNVNMLATKEQAHRIALNIREEGRHNESGSGRLKKVQAIGWYLEEANLAQISTNISDYKITPVHTVFEECVKDAKELQLAVCGSQVVGLLPLDSLLAAAEFYQKRDNLFLLEEDQKLRLAIERLGLASLGPFNPKERIIEYMIESEQESPLLSIDLRDFILTVGSRSPSPGGGSVSAAVGSLGAALGAMVGFLSYGNRKFESIDSQMRTLLPQLYDPMKELMPLVDADATAFAEYMKAMKLPKNDEEERKLRQEALQRGLIQAVAVPLQLASKIGRLWDPLEQLAKIANLSCKSDLQVCVRCLETAVWGAFYNVQINLVEIQDEKFKITAEQDIEEAVKKAQKKCQEILKIIESRKT